MVVPVIAPEVLAVRPSSFVGEVRRSGLEHRGDACKQIRVDGLLASALAGCLAQDERHLAVLNMKSLLDLLLVDAVLLDPYQSGGAEALGKLFHAGSLRIGGLSSTG